MYVCVYLYAFICMYVIIYMYILLPLAVPVVVDFGENSHEYKYGTTAN